MFHLFFFLKSRWSSLATVGAYGFWFHGRVVCVVHLQSCGTEDSAGHVVLVSRFGCRLDGGVWNHVRGWVDGFLRHDICCFKGWQIIDTLHIYPSNHPLVFCYLSIYLSIYLSFYLSVWKNNEKGSGDPFLSLAEWNHGTFTQTGEYWKFISCTCKMMSPSPVLPSSRRTCEKMTMILCNSCMRKWSNVLLSVGSLDCKKAVIQLYPTFAFCLRSECSL